MVWFAVAAGQDHLERRDGVLREDLAAALERALDANRRLEARLTAQEAAVAEKDARTAWRLDRLVQDLDRLRARVRSELETVDAELERLRRFVEEVAAGTQQLSSEGDGRHLSDLELSWWAARSRDDSEPGGRFSALVMLGRERSNIGVEACRARLQTADEAPIVLWQALRNLGRFREVAAAVDVVELLDHDQAVVRSAAHEALVRMGAPDTGFDSVSSPQERSAARAQLGQWVESVQ